MRLPAFVNAKIIPVLCVCLFAAGLVSCTPVRKAEFKAALDQPEDARAAPMKFTRLNLQIPVGEEIGMLRSGCFLLFQKVGQDIFRGAIDQGYVDDTFAETLLAQGYDVVNRLNINFDDEYEDEILRSEYKISAKIIDADIDTCYDGDKVVLEDFVMGSSGYNGELYMKIQWAVYDNLRKKVVYKTQTEGYTKRKRFNLEGLTLMVNEAFAMAAHNLGADKDFHDLMFFGTKPPVAPKVKKDNRPRLFEPHEKITIQNPPLSQSGLGEHIDKTRKIAVLVEAGAGHGSGFFITDQGHILTNAHVVGNAMRVRIVTADKAEKLIAEVLRKDVVRDVALLKLEAIPNNLKIVTTPIKTSWPAISDEIYALGAPRYTKLMDTLTKGIVSAHRVLYRVHGHSQDYIQGDVSIHGGNSGGPLLDAYGNIVGLSVAGFGMDDSKSNAALNLFIPIGDALKKLDIELAQNRP